MVEIPNLPVWPDREARFYARALDCSDYTPACHAALSEGLAAPASLIDVGAGAGHPLAAWLPLGTTWTALEPSRYLRARLGRLARTAYPGLRPLNAGWQNLPEMAAHEMAFAANIGATLIAPLALLRAMRARATRAVAWIVPAQRGPRRWCLSGALPAGLHGEDEAPAVDAVLAALCGDVPDCVLSFGWTFRARFPAPTAAEAYCLARLGWPPGDPRRAALADHLARSACPLPGGGLELAAPKRSALLIWNLAR